MQPLPTIQSRAQAPLSETFEHLVAQRMKDALMGLHPGERWQVMRIDGVDLGAHLGPYLVANELRHRIVPLEGRTQPLTPYRVLDLAEGERQVRTLGLHDIEHPELGFVAALSIRFVAPDGTTSPQLYLAAASQQALTSISAEIEEFGYQRLRDSHAILDDLGRPAHPIHGSGELGDEERLRELSARFESANGLVFLPRQRGIPGFLVDDRGPGAALPGLLADVGRPVISPDPARPVESMERALGLARRLGPSVLLLDPADPFLRGPARWLLVRAIAGHGTIEGLGLLGYMVVSDAEVERLLIGLDVAITPY